MYANAFIRQEAGIKYAFDRFVFWHFRSALTMSKQSLTQIIDKGFKIYNQPQEHLAAEVEKPEV